MIRRFLCLGSLNVDLTFPVERMPEEHEKLRGQEAYLTFGGAAANTAHWLARFGHAVTMLGCVGADPLGEQALLALADAGVDTHLVQRVDGCLTGVAAIFVNPSSKRMVTSSGANLRFDPEAVPQGVFSPKVHLHVATSLLALALPLIRLAKAQGASVSMDLDEGPDSQLAPWLDWVFMNHTSLRRWTGANDLRQARNRLAPHTELVVTCGDEGALALSADTEVHHPAFPVEVVDRTGGGDAFAAGFLHGLSQGGEQRDCLREGLYWASQVIARSGCRPEINLSDRPRDDLDVSPKYQNGIFGPDE